MAPVKTMAFQDDETWKSTTRRDYNRTYLQSCTVYVQCHFTLHFHSYSLYFAFFLFVGVVRMHVSVHLLKYIGGVTVNWYPSYFRSLCYHVRTARVFRVLDCARVICSDQSSITAMHAHTIIIDISVIRRAIIILFQLARTGVLFINSEQKFAWRQNLSRSLHGRPLAVDFKRGKSEQPCHCQHFIL